MSWYRWVRAAGLGATMGCLPTAALEVDAARLVEEIAELGPRVPGSAAHLAAREALVARLEEIGLSDVTERSLPDDIINIEAVSPGSGEGEVVVAAHYDSVASSPGALDDLSGCAVAIAALAEIHAVPHHRTVRLVLFDGEEQGLIGSQAWSRSLSPQAGEAIVAALVLEMLGDAASSRPLVLDLPARSGGGRRFSPAWLVHQVTTVGEEVDFPMAVGSSRAGVAMQILSRTNRVPYSSDRASLVVAGIPAVLLTDFDPLRRSPVHHGPGDVASRLDAQRLDRWTQLVVGSVLALDRLAGRPSWEDDYLYFWGRVWIRRDLMWVGFVLWVAMVFAARPGRWAGAEASERRTRGRRYLPGYLFRLSYLGVTFLSPTIAGPIVFPLALISIWRSRRGGRALVLQAIGALPTVVGLVVLVWARALGATSDLAPEPLPAFLVVAALGTFCWQMGVPAARSGG
ncbi:MAG: M28 family peptidase [Acidobacteriota bacterium]|nr:M28 family peptidase [Acidobacteriota bacterium]